MFQEFVRSSKLCNTQNHFESKIITPTEMLYTVLALSETKNTDIFLIEWKIHDDSHCIEVEKMGVISGISRAVLIVLTGLG